MSGRVAVLSGLGLAAMVAGALVGWAWWTQPTPPETFEDVSFDALDPATARWVRVRGQAHYPTRIHHRIPETLWRPERRHELFAFFPEGATEEREIPLLVRTQRTSERIVAYETLIIEGRLTVPSRQEVPPGTERSLGEHAGYFFAEPVWLLQPVRIIHEDGVWEEPGW